jgi:hypothetical protein
VESARNCCPVAHLEMLFDDQLFKEDEVRVSLVAEIARSPRILALPHPLVGNEGERR